MPGTWLKPYEGKGALRGFLVSRVVFTLWDLFHDMFIELHWHTTEAKTCAHPGWPLIIPSISFKRGRGSGVRCRMVACSWQQCKPLPDLEGRGASHGYMPQPCKGVCCTKRKRLAGTPMH